MRITALIIIVAALPAAADPAMECAAGGASSQIEIAECVAGMEMATNGALDAAYGIAAANASELDEITESDTALPALEAAQDAWRAWRDAECAWHGALYGGGSGTSIAVTSCRIRTARDRIDMLLGP